MRRIWLKKIEDNDTWDLLPQDRTGHFDETVRGCPYVNVKGFGYKQDITQNQVGTEYFISKILSRNQPITGIMLFDSTERVREFCDFVGDFGTQMLLYYSPDGEDIAGGSFSAPYYKKVTLSQIDKTETDEFGWYEMSATISTQDDCWRKEVSYSIPNLSSVGQALVYPYTYPYIFGGKTALKIDFTNEGREVGCVVKIKNNFSSSIDNLEWFVDRQYYDYYGVLHENAGVQRSKWNLKLPPNSELVVDSNPLTQEAKVVYSDGTGQSIIDLQEPDWGWINFIKIKHGKNRFVFYVNEPNVDISFGYSEQKEII